MANEIVKYHNDMASVSLKNFSPTDLNCFSAIIYECKGKGTRRHAIYVDELKRLSGYSSKDHGRFMAYLDRLTDKAMDLKYRAKDESGLFEKFHLFNYFKSIVEEDTGREALIVEISSDFAYILNTEPEYMPNGVKGLLHGGYTKYELRQHNELSSTYAKNAFRQLKRFERTGWWQVKLDEFRRLMDVPESYRLSDLRRRVLAPIKEELSRFFKNLNIEEIKGKGPNGRKTTTALKFTFVPNKEKGIWYEDESKGILEDKYKCPYCGEPLYMIIKKNGDVFYGHKEGWKANALCSQTFGSLDEILGYNGDVDRKITGDPDDIEGKKEKEPKIERAGFSCRKCGKPLYKLYNEKGEMFYGHIDAWSKTAPCRKTYSSIADIKGYSETPTREDHYDLYDREEVGDNKPEGAAGVYETIKNIVENNKPQR